MLARCQFGIQSSGKCRASFTYPIRGYPWRRNITKSYEFEISKKIQELLLSEVCRIMREFPTECLNIDQLWNDSSEKANAITRDRETNALCYTIGTYKDNCDWENNFSIRENSKALVESELYKIISDLIKPYETL